VSNDKDRQIVPNGPQGLLKTSSSLVRRGLDDLSRNYSGNFTAELWFEKGKDFWNNYDYADAIQCFEKALEVNPSYVDAWLYKSSSLQCLDRLTDSIEPLNKCLEIDPSCYWALDQKGYVLARLRRFHEAIDWYESANRARPAYAHPWFGKGEALYELGRYDDALYCYNEIIDKSLEIDVPVSIFSVFSRKADALVELGRIDDAINSYEDYVAFASAGEEWEIYGGRLLIDALKRLQDLKSKTRAPEAGSPRYAYVVREQGAPIEAGSIGYPDIETAILEALKQKDAQHEAGEISDEAYRGAVNQYQTMIKEHIQKNRQQAHE
jgi:tetratricopeptide (TPR) repeat protein